MKDDDQISSEEAENTEETSCELGDIRSVSTQEITEYIKNDSLGTLMNENYLEYASYVLKDRSLPDVFDGLKPVQRRVLHTMHSCEDGRFHKVANVIGETMKYHPHGDASIGEALVTLANKALFIDTQGNFGNIYTGDGASAPRYIECRLLPLAKDVLFNKDITEYVESYDGRNMEPVCLPSKIPTVLLLGVMGIGVTLRSTIFSHNFNEVLDAQIAVLENRPFTCYPDFLTGGLIDVSNYDDGAGFITARAVIEKTDDKTLTIKEIPAGIPTEKLVESIEKAYKQNKIKISSISDFTAEDVAIEIKLPRGVYADEVLKQLYVHTDCETKLFSNIIVLYENRPKKMTVTQIIHLVTERLVDNLGRELEMNLSRLQGLHHRKTLARIFIENRIYKKIEECETEEAVYAEVFAGLAPFRHELLRDVTEDDVSKLLDLCIRRISKFDMLKNQQELDAIMQEMAETHYHMTHLREYTIDYIRRIQAKYGALYPRKTRVEVFSSIDVRKVALQNIRVYHDKVGQFIGSSVKPSSKDSVPILCTEFDRLLMIKGDGTAKVSAIVDKAFVGPVKFLFKADKKQVYSMLYREKKSGKWYAKRFVVSSYIMDKEYALVPDGCVVEFIYTTYGAVTRFDLKKRGEDHFVDVEFAQIPIRAWTARGFKVADFPIAKTTLIKRGSEQMPLEDTPQITENHGEESEDIVTEQNDATNNETTAEVFENQQVAELIEKWRENAELAIANIRDVMPLYSPNKKNENEKKSESTKNTKGKKKTAEVEVVVPAVTEKPEVAEEQVVEIPDVQFAEPSLTEEGQDEEKRDVISVAEDEVVIPLEEKAEEISNKKSADDVKSKKVEKSSSEPAVHSAEKSEDKPIPKYPHPTPLPKGGGTPRKLIDESEDFFLS